MKIISRYKIYVIYSIFLMSILLISNRLSYLMIGFLLFLLVYMIIKKNTVELFLMLTFITPLSGYESYYKIGSLNFSELIIITFYLGLILKKLLINKGITKTKLTGLDKPMIIFYIYIILNSLISIRINSKQNILQNLKYFIIIVLVYFMIKKFIKQTNNIYEFLNLITISLGINSIIIFAIYRLTNVSLLELLDWEGRYGISSQTLYIITVPYCVYLLNKQELDIKNKILVFLNIVLELYLLMINGSRSITIAMIIIGLYIAFKIISDGIRYKSIVRYFKSIFMIIAILVTFLVGCIYLYESNSIIVQRMDDFVNKTGTIANLDSRSLTNDYNMSLVKESNYKGYGIGENLYMIGSEGNIYSIRPFIDNAFVSLLYKFGIVTFIFIILILAYNFILGIVKTIIEKKSLFIVISTLMLIVTGGIYTAQLLASINIFGAFLGFLIYMKEYTYKINI